MSKLKELREKRAGILEKMQALQTKAETENRNKTAEEVTEWTRLDGEWKATDGEVKAAELLEARAAEGAAAIIKNREKDNEEGVQKQFRMVGAIKQLVEGRKLEGLAAEMQVEAEKEARELGIQLNGNLRIPGWLAAGEKRDMTVGTTTAGGHTVATNLGELVPVLNPRLVLKDLGAQMMTGLVGNLDLPRHTTKPTATWAAEQGALSESDPVFDKISLTPNRLGAIIDYSKTLLAQSSVGIENFVRLQLNDAVAIAVDTAGLHGRDTANQPGGIVNANATAINIGTVASGVNSVVMGTNGGAPTWATLVSLETAISAANGDYGNMAYLVHPNMVGKLKATEKVASTGLFLWGAPDILGGAGKNMGVGEVNGYRGFRSTLVASGLTKGTGTTCSYIYFGNWNELLIGQWGGLDIVVDPYTQAANGNIRLVVQSWWDTALLHPAAFAVCLDATY